MSISEKKNADIPSEKDVPIYLSDIVRGVQKFWWMGILLAVLFGGAAMYWCHAHFVPLYQTSAVYTVLTQNETFSGAGSQSAYSFSYSRTTAERLAAAFDYAANSSIFQKEVCQELEVPSMPASLSVEFAEGTNLMTVSSLGKNPDQVYDVLLLFVEHYSDVTTYITGPTKLVTISEAVRPTEPSNSQEWLAWTAKAGLVGLALGVAWILLYAILRQTIRAKGDIHQELNQTCMGVLPQVIFKRQKHKTDSRVLLTNPRVSGDFLESLRLLRDALQNRLENGEKVVLITSTAPREGKSVVTLNLGAILAKAGKKVLVVDGDLRNSGIGAMLEMKQSGASEGRKSPLCRIEKCDSLGIHVLSFDTQNHSQKEILRTEYLCRLAEELKPQYDLILMDTPPCGMISDTVVMAGAADAAVYVIRQDRVLTARIRKGIHTLHAAGIPLLGCVLNGAAGGGKSYGYGYRRSRNSDYGY